MKHLALAGGTDVAAVALFASSALPSKRELNEKVLATLERDESMVRFSTGADGAYLLHLYVDQEIPPQISRYCVQDDLKRGRIQVSTGAIAFGGVESVAKDFEPNENIRSDGQIPPGIYEYVAYHTEFPEEYESTKVASSLSRLERTVATLPDVAPPVAFLLIVASVALRQYVLAGSLFMASWAAVKLSRRTIAYKTWHSERRQRDMQYPSIVVALRSNPSIERTA